MDTRCKRGFTLIEMLVVVVIIGILAGLISAAAIRARRSAMNATVVTDIAQIELALGQYKERFGEFPPDCAETDTTKKKAAILMHLAKAFPRADWSTAPSDFTTKLTQLDPSTALTFFLAGPNGLGWSPNPANPIETAITQGRIGPFLDFDLNRAKPHPTNGSLYMYLPPNEPSSTAGANRQSDPYVYFKARPYVPGAVYKLTNDAASGTDLSCTVGSVTVKPYKLYQDASTMIGWVNPTKFQILSPGLDAKYKLDTDTNQPGQQYPIGGDYNKAQYDDITNFSSGTLESKIP